MSAAPKLATVPISQPDAFEGLIRSKDAARLLCMSEWQLRNLAHDGALAYIQRTPRSPMLFDRADLRAWIEREKIRKQCLTFVAT